MPVARPDSLAVPRGRRGRPRYDPEAVGRVSEALARFFGTTRYLAIQTGVVAAWITFNVVAIKALRFDPYPFILLNLGFSLQAAYAAPLILLAQNRQSERDRLEVERDRDMNTRQLADTDFLARELAAIRITLEANLGQADLPETLARLTETVDRLAPSSSGGD
ncbi:MAG TPA: DUF1003 domain-containing protein [Acidimicrobiales bacterium]|nr:DUF1003 domain-containing protein [Acidimicrobiales bacterium]